MEIINYIILLLGIAFVIIGILIWRKQIASLTLDFNSKNVKPKDIKKYTSSYGIADIICGIGMVICSLSRITFQGNYEGIGYTLFWICFLCSFIIIVRTQIKYKTGLFK